MRLARSTPDTQLVSEEYRIKGELIRGLSLK